MDTLQFDFVVIGSGLAGSTAALLLSQYGEVALLSKEPPTKSNSYAAQGGIAASVSPIDSPVSHMEDTLYAGDGFCDRDVVTRLVARAADYIDWLIQAGVVFDMNSSQALSLGLEGAHSHPRILHAGGDATGSNVLKVLAERAQINPQIWTCYGAQVQSLAQQNGTIHGVFVTAEERQQFILGKKATILATGGLGQLFASTTNPLGATGEGIALAYKAGAIIRNMEFVQFHPTALQGESNPKFLISEAVRGAGAFLIDGQGKRIMADHPQRDLAPRDQVARRIYRAQLDGERVLLDGTGIANFQVKFPTIYAHCRSVGIDPYSQSIPVTPAAHFAMGGIMAELNGRTSLPGLYAIGEVACTGVHGANRLASNSMLECIGMAHELTEHLRDCEPLARYNGEMTYTNTEKEQPNLLTNIQQIMWRAAGIVRDRSSLVWGLEQLQGLKEENPQSAILTTAELIVQSALERTESRGAHYRSDYPEHSADCIQDTMMSLTNLRDLNHGKELQEDASYRDRLYV